MANNQTTELQRPSGTQLSEQQMIGAPAADFRSRGLSWASPFGVMSRMLTDMTRLMDSIAALQQPQGGAAIQQSSQDGAPAPFVPALEVVERDGQLIIRADMPGLSTDHIRIEVENHQIRISGEREEQRAERQGNLYRSERNYGSFARVVSLPDGAQPEQATATFRDGVLEIAMPAPRRAEARRIEVQEEATREPQKPAAQSSEAGRSAAGQPSA